MFLLLMSGIKIFSLNARGLSGADLCFVSHGVVGACGVVILIKKGG